MRTVLRKDECSHGQPRDRRHMRGIGVVARLRSFGTLHRARLLVFVFLFLSTSSAGAQNPGTLAPGSPPAAAAGQSSGVPTSGTTDLPQFPSGSGIVRTVNDLTGRAPAVAAT